VPGALSQRHRGWAEATRTPSAASSSRTARRFTPTATGCSARCTMRRTRSRTPFCGPGGRSPSSGAKARFATGCTRSRPTFASTQSPAVPSGCYRSITDRPHLRATRPKSRRRSLSGSSRTRTKCSAARMGTRRPRLATSAARCWNSPSSLRCSTSLPASGPCSFSATCSASPPRRWPTRSRQRSRRSTGRSSAPAGRWRSSCWSQASLRPCRGSATGGCERSWSASPMPSSGARSTRSSPCWPRTRRSRAGRPAHSRRESRR
jgi:hypothetical protein